MALRYHQAEDIAERLRDLPRVVDLIEHRSPDAAAALLAWIRSAETSLEQARLPQISQLAACRARLTVARRSAGAGTTRAAIRRERDRLSAEIVDRCTSALQAILDERTPAFREAERLAGQVVAIAAARQVLPRPDPAESHTNFVTRALRALERDPDLAPHVLHLTLLVGRVDRLVFIDLAMGPDLVS